MLRGSSKEKDGGHTSTLDAPGPITSKTTGSPGDNEGSASANPVVAGDQNNVAELERYCVADDSKVAELERALAAARDEMVALRQELERVKQDGQASVEVSRYHAAGAHRQATPESAMEVEAEAHEEPHRLQRQDRERDEDLISQNVDLRYRLAELQDQLLAQSQIHTHSSPHVPSLIYSQADWNNVTLRLHEAEKESHARLQQLLSLKSSISSLTRTDSQVSDSELAESFSQLANRVREWVVSNYRRTNLNLHNLPETTVTTLRSIKEDYESIDGIDKLALYQAVATRVLMRIFNELVVIGMPERGFYGGVREFSARIQNAGINFHEWRRATIQVIEKSGQESAMSEWQTEEIQRLSQELERIMLSITSTELTSGARVTLFGILNTAANLQRILCLQKVQYRVLFLDTEQGQHNFDSRTMESVNDLEYAMDEGSGQAFERKFIFCVFPGLEKLVNDMGANINRSHVVFKARVCCDVG